jgi:hypothetical protein
MKPAIIRALSIGVHEDLSESKRVAIQLGTLDAYWSFTCMACYFVFALYFKTYPIATVHFSSLCLLVFSLWLLTKKKYDFGRFLIHFICIYEVFFTVDCYPPNSGIELFYFPTIMIPFITFSVDEQWKGNIQVVLASIVYIVHSYLGTGILFNVNAMPVDRGVAVGFVLSYIPLILGFLRWQVKNSRDKVMEQHADILDNSTMKVIGEMSVEIADKINNPLQSLSLQVAVLKNKGTASEEDMTKMEQTIYKIGKLVQGIKDLRSKSEIKDDFLFSKALEDILIISADRIKDQNIKVYIEGDTQLKVHAHSRQIFQVLMKLITEAMNSLKDEDQKWIKIDICRKNNFIHVSMMTNVSTFKTDLDVSKSVVERSNGSIFLDPLSSHSRIVLLLPLSTN